MGHGLDLGTLNAHVRCPGADDRSSGTQVWSRCVNCAPLSSIFALVSVGVDACRFVDRTLFDRINHENHGNRMSALSAFVLRFVPVLRECELPPALTRALCRRFLT